jgi:DNA-binding ferritin-like protein
VHYTVPGISKDTAAKLTSLLQDRLNSLNDLALTLKHAHWKHLAALDVVYGGIIEAHRQAIDTTEELDQVTQDMLIAQSGQLEQFHWFVRAHLERADGTLTTASARTERSAARKAS